MFDQFSECYAKSGFSIVGPQGIYFSFDLGNIWAVLIPERDRLLTKTKGILTLICKAVDLNVIELRVVLSYST